MKVFNEEKETSFVIDKKDNKQLDILMDTKPKYLSKGKPFTFKRIIIQNGLTTILI